MLSYRERVAKRVEGHLDTCIPSWNHASFMHLKNIFFNVYFILFYFFSRRIGEGEWRSCFRNMAQKCISNSTTRTNSTGTRALPATPSVDATSLLLSTVSHRGLHSKLLLCSQAGPRRSDFTCSTLSAERDERTCHFLLNNQCSAAKTTSSSFTWGQSVQNV